ncbi:MAG: adenylosuccinate synthetase, partial [Bacteroidales bacterium]|nr:adenylosuccinate synthetase [Bacteroidales bacterium]
IHEGKEIYHLPFDACTQNLTPVLKTFKGWKTSLVNIREEADMPAELVDFIRVIEDYVKVPVRIVSTGPDRSQLIRREK